MNEVIMEKEQDRNTPKVFFSNQGILIIAGKSLPENAIDFYNVIIEKIREFATYGKSLHITFEFEYINTASSKCVLNLIRLAQSLGIKLVVMWNYEEDDEDVFELGEYMEEITGLKFYFKEMKAELFYNKITL